MPRPSDEIDDPTPLATARIDIGRRIGWLLRASRTAAGLSLRDFGSLAGDGRVSPATLSRVETEGRRSSRVIAAYERALGLPYGHLRAPVDVLCRTFSYAPPDTEPFVPPPSLDGFTAAVAAVTGQPDAHDWLRWAEYHTATGFGLPADTARPLVERLSSEMGRAAGPAYQLRYEALAKLRCSDYGALVEDVVRAAVTAPGAQRLNDLVSAVTEHPTPDLVTWCGELLTHESWLIGHAGCLGLQNMRSVGGLRRQDWHRLTPFFTTACQAAVDDPLREPILSGTLACLPPEVRSEIRSAVGRHLPAPRRAATWTRSRRNTHFSYAAGLAAQIIESGHGETMLARLLFEILYDFRATHVTTASFVLAASPFVKSIRELLCATALDGPDEITRRGAASALRHLLVSFDTADPAPWLSSSDPVIRATGLFITGFAGVALPGELLRELTTADAETCREALFAAGMAQQPELATLAADRSLPASVREAARWWQREGGRVLA